MKLKQITGASGLEQGFTLNEPPGGRLVNAPLRLALEVSEGWRAAAREDAQLVTLLGERGQAVEYSKLAVCDSLGRPLLAWFVVEAGQVVIEVNDSAATYPLTIDPILTQQAKLRAAAPSPPPPCAAQLLCSRATAPPGRSNRN